MNLELHHITFNNDAYLDNKFEIEIYFHNNIKNNELVYISRQLLSKETVVINEQFIIDKKLYEVYSILKIMFKFQNKETTELEFLIDIKTLLNQKYNENNYYVQSYTFKNDTNVITLYYVFNGLIDSSVTKNNKGSEENTDEYLFNEDEVKLRITELTPLMITFPNKITPSRKITRSIEAILSWHDYYFTLKIYIILNLIILFPSLFIFMGLIISITPLKIRVINQLYFHFEKYFIENESNHIKIKNNMNYIHDQMTLMVNINKICEFIFYNNDKSIYYKFFDRFYLIVIVIIIVYFTFNIKVYLIILLYFVFVEVKFNYANLIFLKLKEYILNKNDINISNNLIANNIRKKINNILTDKSKLVKTVDNSIGSRLVLNKFKSLIVADKILYKELFYYENERWVLGIWSPKNLLLFERNKNSDITGSFEISENSFNYYNNYEWTSVWIIEKNDFTDTYGYQYSSNFKTQFKKNNYTGCYVRRKKIKRKSELKIN